jgi:uncharacterized protein YbaA (DUF1428 family)
MHYVDGFVVPVPTKNLAAYKKMSRLMAKVWREYGALEFRECVADDVKPGKHLVSTKCQTQTGRGGGFFLDCL